MFDPERVFSPVVVFKDAGEGTGESGREGGGDGGGGGGGAGTGEGGGEGGAGGGQDKETGSGDKAHQQHFDRGFNLGFCKGAEKAEKETQARTNKILQALGIDPEGDLDTQLAETGELLKQAREGGGKGDGKPDPKTEEMLKQVRTELQTANKSIEKLKSNHAKELEKILVDQTLLNLAGGAPLAKSVVPRKVVLLFKDDFELGLDKDRNVVVTQPNGAPIIDSSTGEPKSLEGVFKDWIGGQSHLLDKTNTGGSGGAPPGDGGGAGSGAATGGKGSYTPEQIAKMPMTEYEKLRSEGKI